MRRLIVLVPLVLIGGYAVVSNGGHAHVRTVSSTGADPMVAHAVEIASAEAAAHTAEALAVHAEQLAVAADAARHSQERVQAVASAQAKLSVTLDGLLATLQRELERSAETGEPIRLQAVELSAEVLAEVAAELEGMVEIRSDGGDRVVVGSPDGARVEITIQ